MAVLKDLEANHGLHLSEHSRNNTENGESASVSTAGNAKAGVFSRWYRRVLDAGVEENGVRPVPIEQRTQTQHSNLFTVFFTCLLCILPLPTGALGTAVYGLGLRDVSLIIIFFNIVTCIPPAVISIGGCKTGMRQMIQARYSFGLYLGIIPILLNAGTVTGFTLVGSIVSGQAIAAVNEKANISVNCLGYGSLMAGYFMTFGGTVSDFTVYHDPKSSKLKIFTYVYLGLITPSTPLLILGAAIGGALPNVESWQTAWDNYGIGGVMAEMLAPAGGFGKFVLVVLALSVVGNMVLSNYSVALCLQMLVPAFAKVPRFLFIVATLAIMIPMSIYAAAEWEESLVNFLSVIGYWAGCFDAVVIEELIVFRNMDYHSYDPAIWNQVRRLPTGLAAIGASLVSIGLVVPSMDTPWFTGPIGERIGDLGFESAFVVTGIAYYPLRTLEVRLMGHV
ncbi:hypothetical protein BFJ69_g3147 [Fusarium oxysporum]|uniref:Purine-cytosine permease n=1 Tax=Fusarium oxysporum TaxID=5507 RepID=A0A420NQM1_FUSOX|nr:hypothetical protein BFJ69_g3147 [Fusarium oxysporum]